jgi:hypothetical protein
MPGVLLDTFQYAGDPARDLPAHEATLCVIQTSNEGPQWFLLNAGHSGDHRRIGALSAALRLINALDVAPNGRYLAVVSVGEGHPILEVVDLPKLLQGATYTVLHTLDPYPGEIAIDTWHGSKLHVKSDMLLTRLDPESNRVPAQWQLTSLETFALNVPTGDVSGVSEGAQNPAEHYADILLDPRTSDSERDEALTTLRRLNSNEALIMHLLKALEQEQDPKRINQLLEEIRKLRQ